MKRRVVLKGGALILSLGWWQLGFGASILKVRVWPAPDYSRITLESDEKLNASHDMLSNPPRLLITLKDVTLSPIIQTLEGKVSADDPNISAITVAQKSEKEVLLTIALKKAVDPSLFTLNPIAPYQNRLVIDLYPAKAMDTLNGFIAQLRQDKKLTLHANNLHSTGDQDPLGELIAQQTNKASILPNVTVKPDPIGAKEKMTQLAKNDGGALKQIEKKTFDIIKKRYPENQLTTPPTQTSRLIIVAIDPGHGGEDPGAIGPGGTREKDVVLRLAKMVRDRINSTTVNNNPLRTFFTRDEDFFVPLGVRVQKAMKVRADIFMSLHADAFTSPKPKGGSVFALSQHGATSAAAKWLANSENRSDLIGGIGIKTHDIYLKKTLMDMSTAAQIQDSLKLGGHLLKEMGTIGDLHKNQVEQAGFAVLKSPDIPSVLVESAFISNPEEEEKLNDVKFLESLADAVTSGIVVYLKANPRLAPRQNDIMI